MILTKKKNISRKQNLKSRKQISKSRKNGLKSKKNMRGGGKFGKIKSKIKDFFGSSPKKVNMSQRPLPPIPKEGDIVTKSTEPLKPFNPYSVNKPSKLQFIAHKISPVNSVSKYISAKAEFSQKKLQQNMTKQMQNQKQMLHNENVTEQLDSLERFHPKEMKQNYKPYKQKQFNNSNLIPEILIQHKKNISNNEFKQNISNEAQKHALGELGINTIKDLDKSLNEKLKKATQNKGVDKLTNNERQKISANHYKNYNTIRNSYLQKKLEESKKLNVNASVKVDLTKSFTEEEKKKMVNNLKSELTNKENISGYLDDIKLLKQIYVNTTDKNPEQFSKEISRLLIDKDFSDDLKNKMIETFYHLDTNKIGEIITPKTTITTPNPNITKPNPNITQKLTEAQQELEHKNKLELEHRNKLGKKRTNEFKKLVNNGVITETFDLSEKLKTSDLSRDMLTKLISMTNIQNQKQKQLLQDLFNRTNPDTVPIEPYRSKLPKY